jgi:hypothetical protein
MRKLLSAIFLIIFFFPVKTEAQVIDSLTGFNAEACMAEAKANNVTAEEMSYYIGLKKTAFKRNKFGLKSQSPFNSNIDARSLVLPATNIDFESGSFNGWNTFNGINTNSELMSGTYSLGAANASLITAGYTDPNCGINITSPLGGNFVARVNYTLIGGVQTKIQNKIFVTPSSNLLKFAYVTVLQKATHYCSDQPYFAVTLRDTTGKLLFNYFVEAPDSVPNQCRGYNEGNFQQAGPSVFFSGWKKNCVDLTLYSGKNIFLEVIGASCVPQGHWGYGYFDAKLETCPDYNKPNNLTINNQTISLNSNLITVSQPNCSGTLSPITMTAPSWPSFYYWNGPSGSYIISANTQTVASFYPGLHTLAMGNGSVCPITKSLYVLTNTSSVLGVTSSPTLCLNSLHYFTATGVHTYTWSNGQTGPTATLTPPSTGIYTIGVTGQNTLTGCTYSAVQSFTVFNTPSVSVNGNTVVCSGASASFTGSGASSYSWYGVTYPSTVAVSGSVAVFTPSPSSQYTLTGSNSQGCSSSVSFSVSLLPQPGIYGYLSIPTVCPGFTNMISIGGFCPQYTITDGFNTQYTSNTTAITPTAPTIYTVSGANTCGFASFTVFANTSNTNPTITVASGNTLCGASFSLSASGANSYTWTNPATSFTTNNSLVFFYNAPSGVYTVSGKSYNGGCISTRTINVSVQPSPTVVVTPSSVCTGTTTTINITGGGPSYTITPLNWLYSQIGTVAVSNGSFVTNSPAGQMYYQINTLVNGCVASNSLYPMPADVPVTLNIVANTNTVCAGGSATLIATGAAGPYQWSNGPVSPTNIVSPTVSATYSVNYSNGCGAYTASTTVQYTNTSNPTLTLASSNYSPCYNTSYTLSAAGASTYTWVPGNTVSPTVQATGYSSFTVSGKDNNGCINTETIMVNILYGSSVSISGNTIGCPGTIQTYTANGLNTYSWSNGATTQTTSMITPGTLSLTGITQNGCPSGPNSISCQAYVMPFVQPSVSPTGTINSCAGAQVILSKVDPYATAFSYTWSIGAVNTPSILVNPTVTTVYTLTSAWNPAGCTLSAISTVSVFPITPVSLVTSTNVICENNGIITCTLSPAGATLGGINVVNGNFMASQSGIYTVYATYSDPNNCLSSSPVQTIMVLPKPVVSMSVPPTPLCSMGQTFALMGNPAGGIFDGFNVQNSIYTATNAGYGSVVYTYTDNNGCVNYDEKCMSVNPQPNVSVSTNYTLICAGQAATLIASGANTYTWSNNITGSNLVVAPNSTTTYTVTGSNIYGCQSSAVITQSVAICTFDKENKQGSFNIIIFPNPSSGEFTVFTEDAGKSMEIIIYDAQGKQVQRSVIENNLTKIDLRNQPNGIYIARIGSEIRKIVKQD